MNTQQILPKGQKQLIIKALKSYREALKIIIKNRDTPTHDELSFDIYDITGLIGLIEYDVTINLPKKIKENFCHYHDVDFPLFTDTELKYPVEKDRQWVTILTGEFIFIDNEVSGRECYIDSINTIEKCLREDMDSVVDDIERCGDSWIVLENYDGSIEMTHPKKKKKDEREFAVYWLPGLYKPNNDILGFDEINEYNGWDEEFIKVIDNLDVSDRAEKEDVLVIRLK